MADKKSKLGVIFLTVFIDLVGFSIIFPLFPEMLNYYCDGQGSAFAEAVTTMLRDISISMKGESDPFLETVLFGGILGSLFAVLQFIFSPIWGHLSDKTGRKSILSITVAGTAIGYLIWIFSGSLALLILSRIVTGIMGGNISVATAAVADVTGKEGRSKGMAVVGIAFGLGFLLGPAIGGIASKVDLVSMFPFLESWGLNPFSFPALLSFILCVLNFVWIQFRFPALKPTEKVVEEKKMRYPIFQIFSGLEGSVFNASLTYLLFMVSFSSMEFTITFLAVERMEYKPHEVGYLFVFIGFVLMLVQGGFVRRMSGKLGEKKIAIIGLISGFPAFALLAIADSLGMFLGGLFFMSVGVGCVSPCMSALISLYSPEHKQGLAMGIFRSAGAFARAIGPLMGAFLFFYFGSKVSYAAGAILLILPLVMTFALPKANKTEAVVSS